MYACSECNNQNTLICNKCTGYINKSTKPSRFEAGKQIPINITFPEADNKKLQFGKVKQQPKATEEQISETIAKDEIYRRARTAINTAQRKQIAYGIDKYPEPLNADTWTIIETLDHIIEESIDKLHYLIMLRIKFEIMGDE